MDDVDFEPVGGGAGTGANTRQQVLQKYTTVLRQLRTIAEETYRVRPFYFDNYVLFRYFQQRHAMNASEHDIDISGYPPQTPLAFLKLELFTHILDRRRQILIWLFYLLLASLCVFAYRHQNDASSLDGGPADAAHGVDSFVYPSMRIWRRITLPLIQRFPRLTELYDESCLMQNPFFQVEALNCAPCANVESVHDMTEDGEAPPITITESSGSSEVTSSEGKKHVPFLFKIDQEPIELDDFYRIYLNNHEIFQRDAYRVQSTSRDITNLEELFNQFNYSESSGPKSRADMHNMWRCNRMLPARLLRKLFASPTRRLPRTGIALERYMAIDSAQAPAYTLPETECANVYVQQAQGTRYIFLRPTSECRHRCRTLSLRLSQASVLSYNWWYWKPISAPDPVSETLSITLIGSYC